MGLLLLSSSAIADVGSGGMPECMAMSVNLALNAYAQNYGFNQIPNVVATRSDLPPSNGMDIKITINNAVAYYVIAQPNGGGGPYAPYPFRGCTAAHIYRVVPVNNR